MVAAGKANHLPGEDTVLNSTPQAIKEALQVFDGEHRRDLGILGSRSGRDGDKVALTGLTPVACEHGVTFAEATHTLVCRTIYRHDIDLEVMDQGIREALGAFYAEDARTDYVGEVVGAIG